MRKPLRAPVALVFALSGCAGDDGDSQCSMTREPCVQAPNSVDVCPENVCVENGRCPTGCIAASMKFYCVPDSTDAGCPSPIVCIGPGQSCPSGCTPVG